MTSIDITTSKGAATDEPIASLFAVSFQVERVYRDTRHYWTICRTQAPDELVSWGYSRTKAEAEVAAQNEVNDLSAGLTQGGRGTVEVVSRRHWLR